MITRLTLAAAAVLSIGATAAVAEPLARARTAQGEVSSAPAARPGVVAFKALPYAAPPVGDLRWRPPQPPAAWSGVRPGERYPAMCMQPVMSLPAPPGAKDFSGYFLPVAADGMSEDCLYLNVFTPAETTAARLPVMVYVHGGGFRTGAGNTPIQDPSRLAAKGLVVVTVNYRLGGLGFLNHPDLRREGGGSSGDYGLLDQVEALKWVQANVAAFGGDPGKVTIFGGSAGSMSVSLLAASPMARGLFHRVIAQSGTAFGGRALQARAPAEVAGAKLFQALGVNELSQARALPAEAILKGEVAASFGGRPSLGGAFMPETPAAIYAAGRQNPVDFIVGWNAHEDTILARELPGGGTAAGFKAYVEKRFGAAAPQVLKDYPATDDATARSSAGLFFSDEAFGAGAAEWAKANAAAGKGRGYVYYFTHPAPVAAGVSLFGKTGPELRATHGGEMYYVYDVLDDLAWPWTRKDRALAKSMQGYWVNFAKTGDPNGRGLPGWKPVAAKGAARVMEFGGASRMAPLPRAAGLAAISAAEVR